MSDPITYDFGDRLQMSQGQTAGADVASILLGNIPGSRNVIPAHQDNDRHGTDWWVELGSGHFLSVDAKVRTTDWKPRGEDDLALETWSVVERNKVGWTRDDTKRTDYVLWLWQDTGRWCLIPFQMLCAVFSANWQDWRGQYKTRRQHTPDFGGYHSECVFVPRKLLWSEIYKTYSGAAA